MPLDAICQRCGVSKSEWVVRQAEFNVGRISHWKVQLCNDCTPVVEAVIHKALTRKDADE